MFSDLDDDSENENNCSTSKIKGKDHKKVGKVKNEQGVSMDLEEEEEEDVAVKDAGDEYNFDNYDEECKQAYVIN